MLISLDLNTNDSESLLRHCAEYRPSTGDFREDSRLAEALETLGFAIKDAMHAKEAMETIDLRLLEAATRLFGDQTLALGWLSTPKSGMGDKRPIDLDVEIAMEMIARLEHGIFT